MNRGELNNILDKHNKWLSGEAEGERADLYGANLREADLYGANLREADLRGANLYGVNLREADLSGANLSYCEGIISFIGEKHPLIYFKTDGEYYFKIGCITKTAKQWLKEFRDIGKSHHYGSSIEIYGDVIKLFSQYDLL